MYFRVHLFPIDNPMRHTLPLLFLLVALPIVANTQSLPVSPPLPDSSKVYIATEKMPEFPGGINQLFEFVGTSFTFPEPLKSTPYNNTIVYSFIVGPSGKVYGAEIIKGIHPLLDAEALRVVNTMPFWRPGEQGGQKVAVKFTQPLRIQNKGNAAPAEPEEKIYIATEESPDFPGGEKELLRSLRKNFKATYPENPGTAVVSFIINTDGSIRKGKIEVLKSLGTEIDHNLVKAITNLPNFKPAFQNQIPVAYKQTLPIKINEWGKIESIVLKYVK